MKFTPETITKGHDIKFMVPLYQRLFAWSGQEVMELLNDLKFHFDKYPYAEPTDPHFPYYLGVVTTIPYNGKYCLVDGQQRYTVLMIMACAFGNISPEWETFFNNGDRLELFAREEDTQFIKKLASGTTQGKYMNVLMAEAYKTVTAFLANMDTPQQKLFVDRCFSRITLFNSILPSSYLSDPSSLNRYFEVMNSAGVNLEQHEILKVSLLKEQNNQMKLLHIWNICSDFSSPLLKKKENIGLRDYSNEYVRLFSLSTDQALDSITGYNDRGYTDKNNCEQFPTIAEIEVETQDFENPLVERNEQSVISFPEFLLLTLDIYKNLNGEWSFHKVDKLNERFKEYLQSNEIPGFYDLLLKLRIALDLYVIRRKIDGQDSQYSLIYQGEDQKIENTCLEQYEAMLYVSTQYYKWLKNLLIYILDPESDKTSNCILSALKIWDNSEHPYPTSAFDLTYQTVDRYWFWRLDYYLWEKLVRPKEKDEETEYYRLIQPYRQAITDYVFRINRSIEHLHPQNEANNDSWNRADIDSFGNLAMISQSFNSQQSNEDVHVKFSRIESQARNKALQSIKLLIMYLSVKGNPNGWTIDASRRHEDEMLKILGDSYNL